MRTETIASELAIRARAEGVEETAAGLRAVAEAGVPAARALAGVETAAAGIRRIGEAGAPLVKVTDGVSRSARDAEREFQRLENRYDKVAALERQRARELQRIEEAQRRLTEAGKDYGDRLDEIARRARKAYDTQIAAAREAERAQAGLGRALDGVKGSVGGLVAGVAAFASVGAIFRTVGDSLNRADEIADTAEKLGAGIEQLQAYRFAAVQAGSSAASLDAALAKMNVTLGRAGEAADLVATKALDRLFTAAEQAGLRALRSDEAFRAIADRIAGLKDPYEQAALAAGVFGKAAGPDLITAIRGGGDALDRWSQQAGNAGAVVEEAFVVKGAAAKQALENLQAVMTANITSAVLQNADAIQRLSESVAGAIPQFIAGTEAVLKFFGVLERSPQDKIAALDKEAQQLRAIVEGSRSFNPTRIGVDLRLRDISAERADLQREAEQDQKRRQEEAARAGQTRQQQQAFAAAAARENALARQRQAVTEAEARAAAARQGAAEAAVFAARRRAEEEARSLGLVGAQQKEYVALAERAARIESAAKGTARGLSDAAKAAAGVRFQPINDLTAANDNLKKQLDALEQGGRVALDLERQRQARVEEIARIEKEAAQAKRTLSAQEKQQIDALLAQRQALETAVSREAGRPVISDLAGEFQRAFAAAGDRLWDDFARTGRLSIRGLGRDLLSVFREAAIAPLRRLTADLLAGVSSSVGVFTPGINGASPAAAGAAGALRGFSLAGVAQTAAGLGGLALGGGASAFGLASLIGPGALGRFGAGVGNFLGLAGGATDGLSKALAGAGTFGGALGGIGGSVLSGALFGRSTGQSVGSTIGGIAGNLIPIPVLGPLIGSFLGGAFGSLFAGKPSDKTGQVVVDPVTGRFIGAGQKDESAASNRNAGVAQEIGRSVGETVAALLKATGGTVGGLLINTRAGDRDGIAIGAQGVAGEIVGAKTFKNDEAGAKAAYEAGVRLALSRLDTPFDEIDRFVARALEQKLPIEEIGGGVEKLAGLFKGLDELSKDAGVAVRSAVGALLDAGESAATASEAGVAVAAAFAGTREPVDAYAQRTRDLVKTLQPVIDKLAGLGKSTDAVIDAQKRALDAIGKDRNDQSRAELLSVVNPLQNQVEALIKTAESARKGAEEARIAGAPVDLQLLGAAQRAQAEALFNFDARRRALGDPALTRLAEVVERQTKERAALDAAIKAGLLEARQRDQLDAIQAGERVAAAKGLSAEDQLRLLNAPEYQAFTTLGGRIGLLSESLVKSFERLDAGLNDWQQSLRDQVQKSRATTGEFDRVLAGFETAGTPGQRLADLRTQFEALKQRAIAGDDSARASVLDVGVKLRERIFREGGSSAQAQIDARGVEAGLRDVRAVVAGEGDRAQRQLDEAVETNRILAEIRDGLASAAGLDPSRLATLAAGLPLSEDLRGIALELSRLQAERAGLESAVAGRLSGVDFEALTRKAANDALAGVYTPRADAASNVYAFPAPSAALSPTPSAAPAAAAGALDDDIFGALQTVIGLLSVVVEHMRARDVQSPKDVDRLAGLLTTMNNTLQKRAI